MPRLLGMWPGLSPRPAFANTSVLPFLLSSVRPSHSRSIRARGFVGLCGYYSYPTGFLLQGTFGPDYEDEGIRHAVEVKGTRGSYFSAIELTINEWRAAEKLGERFWLYLVANCEVPNPCVQVIRNPSALRDAGRADVSPLLLRFELRPRDD